MMNEFARALQEIDMTLSEFCRKTGTPLRTAQNWKYNVTRITPLAMAWIKLYKELNK